MDFWLDMYTLSNDFLSWAAWVRRVSASSFSDSSVSYEWLLGSGVIGLSSGRLNVTDFVGRIDRSVISLASPPSDSSESYSVLLPVESSLWTRYGVDSGFWSLRNRLTQVWVGCSPLHSLQRFRILMSLFNAWLW